MKFEGWDEVVNEIVSPLILKAGSKLNTPVSRWLGKVKEEVRVYTFTAAELLGLDVHNNALFFWTLEFIGLAETRLLAVVDVNLKPMLFSNWVCSKDECTLVVLLGSISLKSLLLLIIPNWDDNLSWGVWFVCKIEPPQIDGSDRFPRGDLLSVSKDFISVLGWALRSCSELRTSFERKASNFTELAGPRTPNPNSKWPDDWPVNLDKLGLFVVMWLFGFPVEQQQHLSDFSLFCTKQVGQSHTLVEIFVGLKVWQHMQLVAFFSLNTMHVGHSHCEASLLTANKLDTDVSTVCTDVGADDT